MNSKLTFVTILILIFYCLASAQQKQSRLKTAVEQAATHPNLKQGHWSMYARNCQTGKVLVNVNSDKGLAPASNLKLLTSAVALDVLGPDFRMNTYLEYSGNIQPTGKLTGNIYIRGEGDPTLGSPEMEQVFPLDTLMALWVNQIKSLGIRSIQGGIVADDSYLDFVPTPDYWFWIDMGNYYGAGASGLCIHENLYYLFFKPGEKTGDPASIARVEPEVSELTFINHMRTGPAGSGDNGYIYHAPWQWLHQLEGTIPAGVKEFSIKGSLPDPAKFLAQYLNRKLTESGIDIQNPPQTVRDHPDNTVRRTLFYTTSSPPLKDIIYRLNKKSINLYADQILKILGKRVKNQPDWESSFQVVKSWLSANNIPTGGLFLHDGSGLSWMNRITTLSFVTMLEVISRKSYFAEFYNSLPVAGDSTDIGTIKNFCKGTRAAGNLRAKTGGLERVRTHTGYVHTKKGELVCFSMMANDFTGSGKIVDLLHEKIMVQLADLP
jgi:D-alanyl-D-alanine carboxypeptidase/D-alanyl-D-alanine-endopeptidase (penicillin-binding protein 4)